jgi:N-formylglutamate deformylase
MMTPTFKLHQGVAPVLVSMPHLGTVLPEELKPNYVPRALEIEDADWHLDLLYDFLKAMGASILTPVYSRYVIDLNRPPDDAPMYPGASNTELCPTRFFTGEPLYKVGCEPDSAEKLRRRETYWQPYHGALAGELKRLRSLHSNVLLWDAHSIRSEIPWLFDGKLPDLNIGTANGLSADNSVGLAVMSVCANQAAFTNVLNGRFKGGYITRQYGSPKTGIHAVQLEKCQSVYMAELPPYEYRPQLAVKVQPLLEKMVLAALNQVKSLSL